MSKAGLKPFRDHFLHQLPFGLRTGEVARVQGLVFRAPHLGLTSLHSGWGQSIHMNMRAVEASGFAGFRRFGGYLVRASGLQWLREPTCELATIRLYCGATKARLTEVLARRLVHVLETRPPSPH